MAYKKKKDKIKKWTRNQFELRSKKEETNNMNEKKLKMHEN